LKSSLLPFSTSLIINASFTARNISFMDSSGLGSLVAILQRVRTKGSHLYLCSLNDQVKIIMELTKMDKVFTILPDRAAFDVAIA
jgi:anti-anti-sigma factor